MSTTARVLTSAPCQRLLISPILVGVYAAAVPSTLGQKALSKPA